MPICLLVKNFLTILLVKASACATLSKRYIIVRKGVGSPQYYIRLNISVRASKTIISAQLMSRSEIALVSFGA